MGDEIRMSSKEQGRIRVLNQVLGGHMTVGAAAETMQLSVRHTRRILAAYRKEGAIAVVHGNRGRQPRHTIGEALRARVIALVQERYATFNDTHLTEVLVEREGIRLSRSSVRRIRREAGLASPRKRREPAHRVRRARRAQSGQLVQVDGSHHRWFGPDLPPVVLMAAIDDATSTVVAAHFRDREESLGYLQLLHDMVAQHGCPLALYHDKHRIFVTPEPETIDDQLAGQPPLTQVGRALDELGIHAIAAHSPQAKGRVERLFGTFQDRLYQELALHRITTMAAANAFLPSFVARHNQRFARSPAVPGTAFASLPAHLDLAGICCRKQPRTVANDNTVQFETRRIQLLPGPQRLSYARCQIEVQQRLDGSLVIVYQGEEIGSQPAPAEPPVVRAQPSASRDNAAPTTVMEHPLASTGREHLAAWSSRPPTPISTRSIPATDHPWRAGFKRKVTRS
jgi:transposase